MLFQVSFKMCVALFELVIIHLNTLSGGKVFSVRKCEVVCRVLHIQRPVCLMICYLLQWKKIVCKQKKKLFLINSP